MKCPKCKSPELKPKTDNNLFTCPKCGGLWLEGYFKGLLHELNTFTTGGHQSPELYNQIINLASTVKDHPEK